VGIVLGLVLVGGIAATPFYLAKFQPADRAVGAAAGNDVEAIRRVVLALDQSLGAVADMDQALAESERLTPEAAEAVKSSHPDVFGEELVGRLNKTAQMLTDVQNADKSRKIAASGASSTATGPLAAGAAVSQMHKEYLAANTKLRTQAESAIGKLKQITSDGASAGNVLAVNRIEAVFYYAMGRMLCNRADFQQEQTSAWRRAAVERLDSVASLQRAITALDAQKPTLAIANVQDLIKQLDKVIEPAERQLSELQPAIDKLAADLAKQEKNASAARQEIAEIEARSGRARSVEDSGRYEELAAKLRKADARIAALQNGTLVDAKVVPVATADETFSMKYEGGTPQPGLRDLRFRLEQLQDDVKTLQASRSSLQKQEEALKTRGKQVETQQREAKESAERYSAEVTELLAKADTCADVARKTRTDALGAFGQAEKLAKSSVNDAKNRTTIAAGKAKTSGIPNECFEMINKDGDTEASQLCLSAEIAFNIAVTNAGEIQELKNKFATQSLVAKLSGGEAPADVDEKIQKLRTEAMNKLADAVKNLDAAEKLIQGVNVKSPAGTVNGANYVWQVQVGQAAVQMMRATLAELVDGKPDQEAQEKAYELLKKVAQGREQSPLISPALDTLRYLQQTVE
jgi:chromosome segregation ATPase